MNSTLIGAVAGAILGAGGGGFLGRALHRRSSAAPKRSDPAPKPALVKHELFGVPTSTLSRAADVFVPLTRFHELLRHEEEFSAFKLAVQHLDNLYGLEASLHGKGATPKNAKMAAFAQRAANDALAQLRAIVEFGDQLMPSATRRGELQSFIDSIKAVTDEIIQQMHNLLAGYAGAQ